MFLEWNINGARYNKIHLAAKFMDRFTTKFCGWGTLTQDMADNWYKTNSNLEQSGHDLLDTVLSGCKLRVSTKAKTKECFGSIDPINSQLLRLSHIET